MSNTYQKSQYNQINDFPKESFLVSGISHYQHNLEGITYNSEINIKTEPENQYDSNAIQVIFNEKCIGYVPNKSFYKELCKGKLNQTLKILNIKREPESKNIGVRVSF